jgi:hypothetical protein
MQISTDKASPKTSGLPDSVLRDHRGIERQNTFEEVRLSLVTGGGWTDASPPDPIGSSTLSAPPQKAFEEHSLWRVKRRGDFRGEQNRNGCFLRRPMSANKFTEGLKREHAAPVFVDD